tara:strand:+ start:1009 stop:1383 length:375 start_codon:yes stop_codon:yes gene_type:complete
MIKSIILVFIGGGVGSVCRFLISKINYFEKTEFPYSTLIVNIIGCFLIGFFVGLVIKNFSNTSPLFILFCIGFCGGFTTFSTFGYEVVKLITDNQYLNIFIYVSSSVIIGVIAVLVGIKIAKYL